MLRDDEFEFANDVRAAFAERPPRVAWILILSTLFAFAAGVAWASLAVVEETTTGAGRVIPSRQLQVVQTLEGGIVREIRHEEGDMIEAGDVLMLIDDTGFSSRLGELEEQRKGLLAEAARLEAEAAEAESFSADRALETSAPGAVAAERMVFRARAEQLSEDLSVLNQQLVQRQQERTELKVREQNLLTVLEPLQRELELNRSMLERGAVPEIEVLKLERELAQNQGDLDAVRAAMPRARTAIEEARQKISNRRADFRAEAVEKLATNRSELAVIEETLRAARDRVQRATLRAPVRGIINKLNVTTIGAVVQPGQSLMEIVPIDDALLIEARVRPQDVAFIRPQQDASVKLSAYDYRVYGTLRGKVERISADTIADKDGNTYYQVIVRTAVTHLLEGDRKLPIIPGMVATVDILTGEKTVLDYLLNPIVRVRHEAFRER